MLKLTCAILLTLGLLDTTPLRGQFGMLPTRPFADWRTIETDHFVVHYPYAMAEWTLPLVTRLEAVHNTVTDLVGNAPRERITVLVADPFNLSNGSALPFLDAPAMVLWPTPPGPRSAVGHHRSWGELLAVHEYGHLAHLSFPSRNPWQRALWRLLPINAGPVARRSPRWVIEGYATYIEGKLTGSGRPNGVFRAAVLRQWALEGQLPTYEQMSGSDEFLGGAMAYLAGSAFLEWLVEQRGEESLNHLWRRISARRSRSFTEAFEGVYGGTPRDLYGHFTVDVTRQALAVQERLRDAGLVAGEPFQNRRWATGDPAVSPDGSKMAVVLGNRNRPSRLVVWNTADEPEDERAVRTRERLLRRDPEDVPAIEPTPRPKRPVAVLHPVDGRPHEGPRFLPEGRWILVSRSEPLGDGTYRPDLFLWDWEADELHRVTHGAGVRDADPSPAGRTAVGTRCLNGICDLVRVDLGTGTVETIHAGLPDLVFYRPRYSPNGRQIVVAVQQSGRWRLALTDEKGAPLRYVGPDDGASRYDANFFSDGESLVAVSEAGGIPNLEHIDLATNVVRPLTRVTSIAVAPEPNRVDGSLFFLHVHSNGVDVNQLRPDSVGLNGVVALAPELFPAAPRLRTTQVDTFRAASVTRPHPYGVGPNGLRFLLGGTLAPEGDVVYGVLARSDPVGRLGWMVQGAFGNESAWSGAGASLALRRFRPTLQADLFAARQRPSEQWVAEVAPTELDVDYVGATAAAELARDWGFQTHGYRLGASLGRLNGPAFPADSSAWRRLAFAEYRGSFRQQSGTRYFAQTIALHGAVGHTADEDWKRVLISGSLGAGIQDYGALVNFTYGEVGEDAPVFERMLAGGARPLLFDDAILTQRRAMPAVPLGVAAGTQIATARADLLLGVFRPFFWAVSDDELLQNWYRVVGLERELNVDPIPLLRIPGVRLTTGLGYTLDEPFRHKTRAYLSLAYRP